MKRHNHSGNGTTGTEADCHRSHHFKLWSVVGGMALVAAGIVLVRSLPDIKRYIKISTM